MSNYLIHVKLKEREQGREKIFRNIMNENFPDLKRNLKISKILNTL